MRRALLTASLAAAVSAAAGIGAAATCTVPSVGHHDIQSAVADLSCTEIVLAARTFVESPTLGRSLTLSGAGSDQTFIEGGLEVIAGTVLLEGLHLTAPDLPLNVHSGAVVSGSDVIALTGAVTSLVFADGFEGGDVAAWSFTPL